MDCIESKTLASIIDKTFAVRLYKFVELTDVCDPMSEEEREYLMYVAKELLKHQLDNCRDEDKWYYDNIRDIIDNILKNDRR